MEKLNLIELNSIEQLKIEGGSELSEAITRGIGVIGSYMKSRHWLRCQYDLAVMGH
jgi:hypothetical protein